MDSRASSPVVGKLLVSGLVVLYVSSMTGLLVGGVVPAYQTAVGEELGERVLSTATGYVERGQPSTDSTVDVRVETDLPATLRDERYRLRLVNETLVLDHPDDALDARSRLSFPENTTAANSTWHSGDEFVVTVTGPASNRTVRLGEGDR